MHPPCTHCVLTVRALRSNCVRSSYEARTHCVRSSCNLGSEAANQAGSLIGRNFVCTSYEVRTKCVRSAYAVDAISHPWLPGHTNIVTYVTPHPQAVFPLFRHTAPAEKERNTALGKELSAAKVPDRSASSSSSSSAASLPLYGHSAGAAPPTANPLAAPSDTAKELGPPWGTVWTDPTAWDALGDAAAAKLALDTTSGQALLTKAVRDPTGQYAWT